MTPKVINLDELFEDAYTLKILSEATKFMSISEFSIKCNIPISTCYRRIKQLQKLNLLEVRGDIVNGVRFNTYKKTQATNYQKHNPKARKILDILDANPGILYSEIKRLTGYPNSILRNHISNLLKYRNIDVKKFKNRMCFFPLGMNTLEKDIAFCIRKETSKNILAFLIQKNHSSLVEISSAIKKSPSTTCIVLTQLNEMGIINRIHGPKARFELIDKELSRNLMNKINPNILEKFTDRFSDTFSYF